MNFFFHFSSYVNQSRATEIKMLCLSGFSQYLSEKGLIQFDYKAAFQNKT